MDLRPVFLLDLGKYSGLEQLSRTFLCCISLIIGAWLRSCATSQTVPGSIPGGVIGFFSDTFPSDCTLALGLTQTLVKMSTGNIPGGKDSRCVRLTSPLSRAECHEIWEPKPPGTLWATPGLLRDSFTFISLIMRFDVQIYEFCSRCNSMYGKIC